MMADMVSRARACFQRGESQLRQKSYFDAEVSFREALKEWAEVDYPASNEKASTLHGLGLVAMQQSRFSTAEAYLSDSLSVHRRLKPPNNPETLSILQALGACLLGQGKLARGKKVLQECIDLSSESTIQQKLQKAGTTYELGRCLLLHGNYSHAEEKFVKALDLFEKAPNDIDYLNNRTMCLNSLAECTFQQFKIREAVSLSQKALVTVSKMLSSPSEMKPTTCCLLALCLQVSCAPSPEVEKLLRQTQELTKFVGHIDTKALILSVVGEIKTLQGNYTDASQMLQDSLSCIENVEFVDLERVSVTCRLAECLVDQGKHQEACKLLENSKERNRDALSNEHPLMGRVLLCHGKACCDGEKWEEAEVLLQSAFCVLRKCLPNHPRTCEAMSELSYCLKMRGKNSEAADVLARGWIGSDDDKDPMVNLAYLSDNNLPSPTARSAQQIDQLLAEVDTIRKEKKILQTETKKLKQALTTASQLRVTPATSAHSSNAQASDKVTDNKKHKQQDVNVVQPKYLRVFKRLGQGAFGETHVAHFHGSPVALKTYTKILINRQTTPTIRDHFLDLQSMHHPNITNIYGATINDGLPVQLVMELMEGSLKSVINAASTSRLYLTLREQIDVSVDCLSGLDYLHNQIPNALVHGDVCLSNVLVTSTMKAKLSDFGQSRFIASLVSINHSNSEHNAHPKMSLSQSPASSSTKAVDIYNLGTALAKLFTPTHSLVTDSCVSLNAIERDDLRRLCAQMIADEASDRIDSRTALLVVESTQSGDEYNECPPKRMVKGTIHGGQLMLVDKPW